MNETKHRFIKEKCNEHDERFILMEEVEDDEGLYYHVIINGWVEFSNDDFDKVNKFYNDNIYQVFE